MTIVVSLILVASIIALAFALRRASMNTTAVRVYMTLAILFVLVVQSFAQVTLTIPTDEIFESTNTWMTTFAPILSIGFGISIAIAVLTLIGHMIVNALKTSGRR